MGFGCKGFRGGLLLLYLKTCFLAGISKGCIVDLQASMEVGLWSKSVESQAENKLASLLTLSCVFRIFNRESCLGLFVC